MLCQLDQVGSILSMTAAVQKALLDELPREANLSDFSLKASSIIYGLLVLHDHDVFLKKGGLNSAQGAGAYYWVELYMDGELFILAVVPGQEEGGKLWEIIFMLEDETLAHYEFGQDSDVDWCREDCEQNVWQAVLQKLNVNQPVHEVLEEITFNCTLD